MKKLYKVTTPYFCCGVEIENNIVVTSAPILKWTVGQTFDYLKQWINQKKGTIEEVPLCL